MKSILVILMMVWSLTSVGQGRQIKMYLEQIAANKVYIDYLQKGYTTVKNGLNILNTIKGGHFSLDQLFFYGLVAINPKVRQYPRVGDIMLLSAGIRQQGNELLRQLEGSGLFVASQVSYVQGVIEGLNADCTALLHDLEALLEAGNLQLSDDERIKRIDQVFAEVSDRHLFMRSWSGEITRLLTLKQRAQKDVRGLETIIGIK